MIVGHRRLSVGLRVGSNLPSLGPDHKYLCGSIHGGILPLKDLDEALKAKETKTR